MAKFLLLNGPNLNLLGTREPQIYGSQTLAQICDTLREQAKAHGHVLEDFQSNAEHELVERVHRASREGIDFILINPGAFTHTSIALRDALLGWPFPSSRSTCPTCMPASHSATNPTCRTWPGV